MFENYLKIEKTARSWVGTNFHHQGRLKKGGNKPNDFKGAVDCVGLIVGVAKELDLKSHLRDKSGAYIPLHKFDETNYSREPNGQRLRHYFDKFLQPIPTPYEFTPGTILLMKFAKYPQHCGVVGFHPSGGLSLIHAFQPVGRVCEHELTDKWKNKIVGVYKFNDESFE